MSRCVSFRRFRDSALRFPPLAPAGDGSPASSVLSERSDFPPSIPLRSLSFARSVPRNCCSSRGSGELLLPAPHRNCAGASILCLRLALVETVGSPRFLGNPFANMRCSSTPADLVHQATTMHQILPSAQLTASAPHSVTFRGSITQPVRSLSTLRSSDCSDLEHRARLASHWRPTLVGQDSHLLGCFWRFPLCG
jgi:hypothetical protein